MYLSKKQIKALQMAQDAMAYRNSGELDKEQSDAYDVISRMLSSALKERKNRKSRKTI
jgi:hypothetical protein